MTHDVGRRPKLSPALRENVCKFIALGVSPEAAAAQEGIARSTFYAWMQRGRAAIADLESRAVATRGDEQTHGGTKQRDAALIELAARKDSPFVELVTAVEQALAVAEVGFTTKIRQAADRDWRAAAWWLERRRSECYGGRETIRVERAPGNMTNDELVSELAALGFVPAERRPAAR